MVLAGAAVLSGVAVASKPQPSKLTLHFVLQSTAIKLTNASGRPATLPAVPGDMIIETDLLSVGNHKHHAKHATASDHYRCVIVRPRKVLCEGPIKIGSSKLLAKSPPKDTQSQAEFDLRITGGTGKYRGYQGVAKFTDSNRSDLTIVVHR